MSDPLVMKPGEGPANDLFRHHHKLVKWTTEDNNGYLHPNVRIAYSPMQGFHMRVEEGKEIKALTRITSSPMACTLSVMNAFDIAPFQSHGPKFPNSFLRTYALKPQLLQAFFLMEQYLRGNKSWWAPYIQSLPTPAELGTLIYEEIEDRAWLEGTNLKAAFTEQETRWQDMYTKGLRDLKILNCDNAIKGKYTWELFRWAAMIFGSRSFTSEVLSDTEPSERARLEGRNGVENSKHEFLKPLFIERFAVLLPLLDILNHQPAAKVEWQARNSFIGMQVLSAYRSSEELCNNYGPRDNESLLMSYGFVIPNNTFDHVSIALKSPPSGSPLEIARKSWKTDLRSTPDYLCYIFNLAHPRTSIETVSGMESVLFSFDLLDALSVLKGNDRELNAMFHYQQTLMSYSLAKPHKFQDFRNLHAVLAQLHLDCSARVLRLKTTMPDSQPRNGKQQKARIYRTSQLRMLEFARALCSYVLIRASSDGSGDDLFDVMGSEHGDSWQLRRDFAVLSNHECITKSNELFSHHRALELLPENQASAYCVVRDRVNGLLKARSTGRSDHRDAVPSPTTKRKLSPNQPEPEAKVAKPTQIAAKTKETSVEAASTSVNGVRIASGDAAEKLSSLNPALPTSPLDPSKTHFTLIVALSLHLYLTGISLPSRLSNWLKQVTEWYPPENAYWNYVPDDGPYKPGEEPPGGLMAVLKASKELVDGIKQRNVKEEENDRKTWLIDFDGDGEKKTDGEANGVESPEKDLLEFDDEQGDGKTSDSENGVLDESVIKWLKPERICWAWNVMEEEGLVVSKNIVRLSEQVMTPNDGEDAKKSEAMKGDEIDFLLYCKQ
jgi:hypothetical protein